MGCKEGMSNQPPPDEPDPGEHAQGAELPASDPAEPCAVVFSRLTDVPLEGVDKLIETTEASFGDLNKVLGHPYWGDLVLHQGAALRALREARDCLQALGAEAVGARNTELGITVSTAVIEDTRSYAHSDNEKLALVEKLLRPQSPESARHFYLWDRPYENEDVPGPYQQIRVVTDVDAELGVLNYTEENDEGELNSWHTLNPEPLGDGPVLRFDAGSALTFPRDAVLRFADLRAALIEFARHGVRPTCVQWQQARWGQ